MLLSHFLAALPLLVLLVMSLVFYGKGLVHILTLSYTITLGIIALANSWEIMFFPLITGTAIIALILFGFSMLRGNWL